MLKKVAILIGLTFIQLSCSQKPIVRWINGLNAPCSSKRLELEFQEFDFKCVKTNTSSNEGNSFDRQIQAGCDELDKEADHLKIGFTLFGVSQGGLIARGILQRCNIGKHIRRLITLGAPHSGVAIVPFTSPNNPINIILVQGCYANLVKHYFGPCSYMRSLRYFDQYKKANLSIFDLNNEGEIKQQYIERIQNLELLMAIGFDSDMMVLPKVTSVFGFYKDTEYAEYVDMEDTILYSQNRIGLQRLEENGNLFRCMVPGSHLNISIENLRKMIVDFSEIGSEKYKQNYSYLQNYCKFRT